MKTIYNLIFAATLLPMSFNAFSQNDEQKVKEVLTSYKSGIETLSTVGLSELFMKDSQVFESGGSEGSFEHYLDHHLGPELKVFKAFKFNDYAIEITIDEPYAFATETYNYRIELANDGRVIEKKGLATTVLKKTDGQWKILTTHSSSRAKK